MTRFCKTCRYLAEARISGEMVFRCEWLMTHPLPWAFLMPPTPTSLLIGHRHASHEWSKANPRADDDLGSDWTEVMDCPTWEADL